MTARIVRESACLFGDFSRFFDLTVAQTPAQKRAVYRVRYNVYCKAFGFEDVNAYQDRCERDEFDAHSVHCLVTHRATGTPAGCVRLVTVDAQMPMPMERHCADTLNPAVLRRRRERRAHMAEISRLAVDAPFCRLRGARKAAAVSAFDPREQSTFPLIGLSLFLAAGAVADLQRRTDCFALMEPFLPILLRRAGVEMQRIGDDLEYRGTRAPYYLDIDSAVRSLPYELRTCYERIRSRLACKLYPSEAHDAPAKAVGEESTLTLGEALGV